MTAKPVILAEAAGPTSAPLGLNMEVLYASRLLLSASSGSGKSRALRRMAEQTFGRAQHIIVDPEGEFATLRERFPYVLAAKEGGETVPHPRTAKLLALKLLELNASAVLDLSELDPKDRQEYVRLFFTALIDAPRRLWHPVLVFLDEAQDYAPEKGQGEATSTEAVVAMASKGRKRGFTLIAATQRLSKLSKSVAAELKNRLIGHAGLDVDLVRAGNELGMTKEDRITRIQRLEPGWFWAYGPALARAPELHLMGPVQTTHPEPGTHAAAVTPPAPEAIRALLPKLADLPAEAAAEAKTVADLQQALKRATSEVKRLQAAKPAAVPPPAPVKPQAPPFPVEELAGMIKTLAGHIPTIPGAMLPLARVKEAFTKAMDAEQVDQRRLESAARMNVKKALEAVEMFLRKKHTARVPTVVSATAREPLAVGSLVQVAEGPPDGRLTPAEQRVLNAVAWWLALGLGQPTKAQVAMLSNIPVTSSNIRNLLGALKSKNHITYPAPGLVALAPGHAPVEIPEVEFSNEGVQRLVLAQVTPAERKVLMTVLDPVQRPVVPRSQVASMAGIPESSSNLRNLLGALKSLGLVQYPQPGMVQAAAILYPEAVP